MFRRRIPACCLLIMAFAMTGSLNAQVTGLDQVGTTSFQFLQIVPNARAAGMGSVGAAMLQSSEAAFYNPAALSHTENLDLSLSYLDWFLDVKLTSFSLSYNLSSFGTVGLHLLYNDIGEFEETRVDQLVRDDATGVYNPGLTGNTFSPNSMVFGLSYAKSLTDKFSFGLTAKFAREDLIAQNTSSIIFDGGLLYSTGLKSLMLGAMLRNFGPEIKYFNEGYPLPQAFSIGVSGYLIGPDNAFLSNSSSQKLLLAYDLAQTRDHSQQQHIGAEYAFSDFLMIRSGYKINFDEEGLTLGFGLKFSKMQFDYAYNDFGSFLGSVQRVSLNFSFN